MKMVYSVIKQVESMSAQTIRMASYMAVVYYLVIQFTKDAEQNKAACMVYMYLLTFLILHVAIYVVLLILSKILHKLAYGRW